MGNYKKFEHDFVDRTMSLIGQYEYLLHKYDFAEQYNYTLLLNCLFGVIVLPKENLYSHIPDCRITQTLKTEMGLKESKISDNYKMFRDLIRALRNSMAHSSFKVVSETDDYLIDRIVFKTPKESGNKLIADFKSTEMLPFLRYYADWIKSNLIEDRRRLNHSPKKSI